MKEINGQLYGYSYELRTPTTEDDLTTCFAIDTGEVFVAYGGIWYAQRNVHWAAGSGSSGGGGGGGGGSGALVVISSYDGDLGITALDTPWQEIYDAISSGRICYVHTEGSPDGYETVLDCHIATYGGGSVDCFVKTTTLTYTTRDPNDYPTYAG